ncbi:MAG: STAS domain-containing protein [Actinomycetota bacterium]|nr:STAS domain-containing protein [Actinomycetota bacterium]
MELSTEDIGEHRLIKLGGEVDIYTAPMLREAIVDAIDKGHYKVAVSLDDVDFLDSTGLGVLMGGLRRIKQHDGELEIVCSKEDILRIFKITGLNKVFKMYEHPEELL